jgi:hypothetical protein
MRMRALTFLAAAILGAAASLVAGCGDRSKLIPSSDASALSSALDDVAAATQSGDCASARAAVVRAGNVLAGLPDSVDPRLRARLRAGIANLRARVPVQCAEPTQTTTPTQTTPTQTTPTQTTPTQTQTTPTETTPTQTTPTTPTQTTTTPTQTTTTPTTPTTPDTGGTTTGGTGGTSPEGQG